MATNNSVNNSGPKLILDGSTDGTVTILPQASAGNYNFNLPATVGLTGQFLTSQGGGAAAMSWTPIAAVQTWSDEAITFSPTPQQGYFVTAAATANLPASPQQGDTISITTTTLSAVVIQAAGSQVLVDGPVSSTSGGTLTATSAGSSITLVYRGGDATWYASSSTGSWLGN